MRRALILAAAVLLLLTAPLVMAATDPRYTALEQRVTALEARVTALEAKPVPTPTPTPTPVPTPTAVPTPTPARPFPAPVTTRTVTVPASIDATGVGDVSGALQAFVNSVPDGSIISFPTNAVYRMSRGIALQTGHNLVFEGNGATLRATGDGSLMWAGNFVTWASLTSVTDIAIRNFVFEGNNPRTGSDIYDPSRESQHGVGIFGGTRIEVTGNTIRHTWGDGVYSANGSTQDWPVDSWVHGNTFDYIGRNAVSLIAARNMLIEQNAMNHIGASVLDIEPDHDYQGVANITLRTNTIAIWGLSNWGTLYFYSCSNQTAGFLSTVNGLTISGNVVTGGPPAGSFNAAAGGLKTWIGKPNRQSNVTFTNNTTTKAGSGPVLRFEHVDGLTVTRNTQPLTSGSLTSVTDSTGVVVGPNP